MFTSDLFNQYNINVRDWLGTHLNSMVYLLSLNIEFSKESSLFWPIYIEFSRNIWYYTMGFSYPKPTFEQDPIYDLSIQNFMITIYHMTLSCCWMSYYLYMYFRNVVSIGWSHVIVDILLLFCSILPFFKLVRSVRCSTYKDSTRES